MVKRCVMVLWVCRDDVANVAPGEFLHFAGCFLIVDMRLHMLFMLVGISNTEV